MSGSLSSPSRPRSNALESSNRVNGRAPVAVSLKKAAPVDAPTGNADVDSLRGLRAAVRQEHVSSLMQETDELRAQVEQLRSSAAASEEARHAERAELVASYERMLQEQAAAVRQFEARASTVGTLRMEARKREAELTAVRQESVVVRQKLAVNHKVWRHSVIELEATLEAEIRSRNALEADRTKFAEIHRKKLQSLQREADERTREAKKVAEREEQAVQVRPCGVAGDACVRAGPRRAPRLPRSCAM